MSHKVLFAVRNPFKKDHPDIVSRPHLVWLTREDQYRDGRDSNRVIGSHYLLMVYGFDDRVRWHLEWNVLSRMHRPRKDTPDDRPFVACVRCYSHNGTLCSCGSPHHSFWPADHPDAGSIPCPECVYLR